MTVAGEIDEHRFASRRLPAMPGGADQEVLDAGELV
jgi:hypothetical protein